MSARLTACTPLLSLVHQSKELLWRHWSVGVSFTNVIIRHERLSHYTAEWSCLLLVEHSHFAFVNADGSHSPLLRYISDYSPRLHPLGAPLATTISSITSMNSSARLRRVRDFASLTLSCARRFMTFIDTAAAMLTLASSQPTASSEKTFSNPRNRCHLTAFLTPLSVNVFRATL